MTLHPLGPITEAEVVRLRRFLGTPSSLAEWADNRDAYPNPYRIRDGRLLAALTASAGGRSTARWMTRLAPWSVIPELPAEEPDAGA